MRKESKQTRRANIASVQAYHQGDYHASNREQYAYMGYKSNKFFTSDRFVQLDENFTRPDGKPLKGYGLEIETVCNGVINQSVYAEVLDKIIFSHFPADLFKMQNDSSLGGRTNAECITQVMSKEFIRNNYAAFKVMYDEYFPAFGIACDRTCGMHCNMSLALFGTTPEKQAEAVKKFYYIINKHYRLMCVMVNRDSTATGYCAPMMCNKEYVQSMDLSNQICSHGVCFNLGHYNAGRIELRLVGGQRSFACFRNTMETIFHLVDTVKRISWKDCDSIEKIFSGCNQYVADRLSKARTQGVCDNEVYQRVDSEKVYKELL